MFRTARPAVFFDKDGVINPLVDRGDAVIGGQSFKLTAPWTPSEMLIYPGVRTCIKRVRACGFYAIVVTNQPDVHYGMMTQAHLSLMLARVRKLGFDDVLHCPHGRDEDCDCRKPKPGMLLQASYKHHIALSCSYMVGDMETDIEAAHRAGCSSVIIDREYNQNVVAHKRITSLLELPALLK